MTSRPTLSVLAMCRNEEKDLPAFLEHLLPWIDEIVLVDDGSTDRTVAIAEAAGEKVKLICSPRSEGEYFSDKLNLGLRHVTSDWVVRMDIDERIPPDLCREILAAIRVPDVDAYSYHRHNFFLHRPVTGCGWQLWRYMRLVRTGCFRFEGKIHDKCVLLNPRSRVRHLKHSMWHYNEDCYEKRIKKIVFYTAVRAETIIESGKRVRIWDLVTRPLIAFFKTYLLFLGFRDGVTGWILSINDMTGTFDAYVLAWDAQNRLPRHELERRFAALSDTKSRLEEEKASN
jgi:(heptosyl)LPS beta-1,4-glucosyltransferase